MPLIVTKTKYFILHLLCRLINIRSFTRKTIRRISNGEIARLEWKMRLPTNHSKESSYTLLLLAWPISIQRNQFITHFYQPKWMYVDKKGDMRMASQLWSSHVALWHCAADKCLRADKFVCHSVCLIECIERTKKIFCIEFESRIWKNINLSKAHDWLSCSPTITASRRRPLQFAHFIKQKKTIKSKIISLPKNAIESVEPREQ